MEDNKQKKEEKKEDKKEDCPLCNISEETLAKLREADKIKKEKENQ